MDNKTLYTVVVADDEDELREAVCRMIPWEALGFSLAGSATNGLDALELVEQKEPDLLLTDIRMPFISGIELARQVREVRPSMHIAFISGYDDFEYAKQAIQYNIISYMLKPITMEGLAKELARIREKMDARWVQLGAPTQTRADQANFVLPLLLDDYAGEVGDSPAAEQALAAEAAACGLLDSAAEKTRMVVLTATFVDPALRGAEGRRLVHLVDSLAAKYLRRAVFFSGGKAVALLLGNASDFSEYLHILADEIDQVARRIWQAGCSVGISREIERFGGLHAAYRAAMEAAAFAETEQGGVCFAGDLDAASRRQGGSQLCRQALAALDEHYTDESLSLVSLAGLLDVSPNHLSACLKKHTGDTFINILIRKRMEAARELLLGSDHKIQEIAQCCGYSDQHYFSYCFKKYCGVSPNALRRQAAQQITDGAEAVR